MPLFLLSSKRLYSQSGLPDKNQGSNSLVFFLLLPSFKRVVLLTRLGRVQGLRWSSLLILMSLSDTFNLASGGFLAAPPLISNFSALWNSGCGGWSHLQEMGGGGKGKRPPCAGVPQGTAGHQKLDKPF